MSINGINGLKLQSEYRKYFGIRSNNTIKALCKDIVGYVSLNVFSKILKIRESI